MSRALTTLVKPLGPILQTAARLGIGDIGALSPGANYGLVLDPANTAGDIAFKYVDPRSFTKSSVTGFLADFALKGISNFLAPGSSLTQSTLQSATANKNALPSEIITRFKGGGPMAWADGDTGFFGGLGLPDFGQVLQGQLGRDLLGIGTQALSGFVTQQFAPQPVSYNLPALTTQAAAMPMIRGMAMVGRSFFNRFPALATAIQRFRNVGQNVTRSSLYSMMKRFGPDFLITGGILSAAAISELAIAGPGRRRMNPGNVKALRRAHRRMKSFHHVCVTNDRLLGARRKVKSRSTSGGTSITRVS